MTMQRHLLWFQSLRSCVTGNMTQRWMPMLKCYYVGSDGQDLCSRTPCLSGIYIWCWCRFSSLLGWVGLWGFLWWAPSANRKDHHGVSSGWSSTWFHSNTGLSSTQYEQIPIIFGVWPFWLTPFFFRSIPFWGLWLNCISSVEITLFLFADILLQHKALFKCQGLVKWLQIHYVNWSRVFFSNDLST